MVNSIKIFFITYLYIKMVNQYYQKQTKIEDLKNLYLAHKT